MGWRYQRAIFTAPSCVRFDWTHKPQLYHHNTQQLKMLPQQRPIGMYNQTSRAWNSQLFFRFGCTVGPQFTETVTWKIVLMSKYQVNQVDYAIISIETDTNVKSHYSGSLTRTLRRSHLCETLRQIWRLCLPFLKKVISTFHCLLQGIVAENEQIPLLQ